MFTQKPRICVQPEVAGDIADIGEINTAGDAEAGYESREVLEIVEP
jgi:hypothetical protein